MDYTTNYGLRKPEPTDYYDVADANFNMDKIDLTLKDNENAIANHTAATTGVHGATSAATPNTIVQRDSAGRAKVAAPAAADDIARKDTVDAVQTNLTNHINATTGVHGATSAATPNTIVQRDSAGRFKAAAPSASDDVARKAEVDAHASDITSHVSFLSTNQYTAAEPITSYPLGVSVMRVTDSDFPASNGNGTVVTVKGTSGTGFQIFVSTANDDVGSAVRGTTGGNWKKWIPFEKAGRVLWSGTAYQTGTTITLADSMDNYSYLIAIFSFVGYEARIIAHKESTSYFMKGHNLVDDGVTTSLSMNEMRLNRIDNTTLTIAHNLRWRWSGASNDPATITPDDSGYALIKIIGVI